MEWGLLIPILAIIMGPIMYVLYLQELKIKRATELEGKGVGEHNRRIDELEQRLRVLERILTDGGVQTAAQIEALRDMPAMPVREKVQ